MNRRKFIKGTAILGGFGLATGLYAWQIEPFWLEFTRVPMKVKNLPKALEGKLLMQISDIHLGAHSRDSYIKDAFVKASAYRPDFVAYTGDFVTFKDEQQYQQLGALLPFAPRGALGTVAIFGNHDYGRDWSNERVANTLEGLLKNQGIPVLRNTQKNYYGLNFIGLDDMWAPNYDPESIMAHWDSTLANIVLCHNPDVMDKPVWNGYDGWVLSGHTHGGQCKPPFLPPPLLPVDNKRYTSGRFDFEDGRSLYINRALGFTWQIRFNVRPEITLFHLQSA